VLRSTVHRRVRSDQGLAATPSGSKIRPRLWREPLSRIVSDSREHELNPCCDLRREIESKGCLISDFQTDLHVEQIISILGKDWLMSTVWGCAFEDFLTREFDDRSNVVDETIRRRRRCRASESAPLRHISSFFCRLPARSRSSGNLLVRCQRATRAHRAGLPVLAAPEFENVMKVHVAQQHANLCRSALPPKSCRSQSRDAGRPGVRLRRSATAGEQLSFADQMLWKRDLLCTTRGGHRAPRHRTS
jgi:hypothetical protein